MDADTKRSGDENTMASHLSHSQVKFISSVLYACDPVTGG